MINFKYYILCLSILSFFSCNKMVDAGAPITQLTSAQVFKDDQSALAVISNCYSQFNSEIIGNFTTLLGVYSAELNTTSIATTNLEFANGYVSVINTDNLDIWSSFYSVIYECNSLLENLETSSNISQSINQQLKAEALFLRSLSYFYLLNLYGNVPLVLGTDVRVTATLPRVSSDQVYQNIVKDLKEANRTISDVYPSSGKVRANKMSVSALLTRIYLYQQNWESAETESSVIVESGIYSLVENLNEAFFKNNKETILEFWTKQGYTTLGPLFIPTSSAIPTYPIYSELLNSFEINDHRKTEWIHPIENSNGKFYYPFKYKNRTTVSGSGEEYVSLLRLNEQYLIRAEARAQQNKIPEALEDLNRIRERAGLLPLNLTEKGSVLSAIEHERKVELFCEWGHRFFDLKRYGHLDQLAVIKPNWKKTSELLPIPQYEILNNPNLIQNPGY